MPSILAASIAACSLDAHASEIYSTHCGSSPSTTTIWCGIFIRVMLTRLLILFGPARLNVDHDSSLCSTLLSRLSTTVACWDRNHVCVSPLSPFAILVVQYTLLLFSMEAATEVCRPSHTLTSRHVSPLMR